MQCKTCLYDVDGDKPSRQKEEHEDCVALEPQILAKYLTDYDGYV